MLDCNCPEVESLVDIPVENCSVNLTQIQRVGIQRVGDVFDSAGTPTPTDILALSTWQAKIAATGDLKIVLTPIIGADPVIEAGDAITTGGGDNSTLNGVEEVEGVNPSKFSCVFKGLSSATEKAMKNIMCEKNLVVYLFLQGGKMACVKVDTTKHKGFLIQTPFVSDRNNAGYGTKDTVNMSFSLPAGWSDDLEILKPNFNPFTDI
jgi:hypothetical protein